MAKRSVGPACDSQGGCESTEPALGRPLARMEPLEGRTLFNVTLTPGANTNASQLLENQSEVSIAVNPLNPNQIFVTAVNDSSLTGPLDAPTDDVDATVDGSFGSLFAGVSDDGGVTWTRRTIGEEDDGLVPACCDGSAAFDSFGNLFLAYIDEPTMPGTLPSVVVAGSTDGGLTFVRQASFPGNQLEQPTIVVGPGSVWVTFQREGAIVVSGAVVGGFGSLTPFSDPVAVPNAAGDFGDIAVGPSGEVTVAYQEPTGDEGPSTLSVNTDPDGLGPLPFGPKIEVTQTLVGGVDFIPAQDRRSVDAAVGLGYDRSGGPFNGRLYMVYTDDRTQERTQEFLTGGDSNSDLDIFLRFSTNQGAAWSEPVRLSDASAGSSQFLPRMAIDQTNGNVGVVWYDTRNETGITPKPNDEARFWGTVAVPGSGGVAVAANVQISTGVSVSERALAAVDFGDYTGLAFHNVGSPGTELEFAL